MLFAACEGKEEKGGGSGGEGEDIEPVTFSVSSSIETRTVLGDKQDGVYRVFWRDGDRICVNGVKSNALHGIADSTVSASFTVSGVTPPYSLVYPSIDCEAISQEGKATVSIPVAQKYVPGSFANGSAILYGHSEGTDLTLSNLCGVVRVPLTAYRTAKLKSVELISKSMDEPLAGRFSLDTRSGELTPLSGSSSVILSLPAEGIDLNSTDTVSLYLAVHAGSYASGFNIRFTDTQDRSMVAEWTGETAIDAGVIANIPAIEFDPSTALEITDIESWELFAAAANAGDWSEWANRNGEVNLLGNISVAGDITPIESWDGIFKGNGFTISRGKANTPIFKTIEAGAVVKDLVVGGKCEELPDDSHQFRVYDVSTAYFIAPLAYTNYGTISGCIGKVDFNMNNINSILYMGGLVMYNAGLMENCSNEGPITMRYNLDNRRWGSIGGLACFGSDGVASHTFGSYTSNYRNIESAGKFIGCSNKADILVTKKISNSSTSNAYYLAGFDLGGICASVNAGTAQHPGLFENCSNSGNISLLEKQTAKYACAYGVAGIVGCIGNHTPLWKPNGEATTSWYEIPSDYASKYTDDTPAGYAVDIKNCSNTGNLELAPSGGYDNGYVAAGVSNPRKQSCLGGIVAYIHGMTARPDTMLNCSNTGALRLSNRYMGSAMGCLAAVASDVHFKDCTVNVGEDKKVGPSEQPDWYLPQTAGTNYRAVGYFGGLFGICFSDVSIESCKSYVYMEFSLTPAQTGGNTTSYSRFPGLFFGNAAAGTTVSISGSCGLGGHFMSYLYNPGKTNLDKKFLLRDLDRDNYPTFICYRDVYDNWYKDMWVESGHTASMLVAITDENFGTVTGKDNIAYWDGK